jgi:hypothetical protein
MTCTVCDLSAGHESPCAFGLRDRLTPEFGKEEILSAAWAALVSSGAVNAAIRAADKAWDNSDGELNQYQLGNIFFHSLRGIIQSVGGRVTPQPNCPGTVVMPYNTL